MNNKGFMRTLEAVIAVMIVFMFIYFVGRSGYDDNEREIQNIRSLQESILKDISSNDDYRGCIVSIPISSFNNVADEKANDPPCAVEIRNFISDSLPVKFKNKHKFNICDPQELGSCTLPTISSSQVYTSAVIITSSLKSSSYDPRILRIWFY